MGESSRKSTAFMEKLGPVVAEKGFSDPALKGTVNVLALSDQNFEAEIGHSSIKIVSYTANRLSSD
jgi:hypothetical protein